MFGSVRLCIWYGSPGFSTWLGSVRYLARFVSVIWLGDVRLGLVFAAVRISVGLDSVESGSVFGSIRFNISLDLVRLTSVLGSLRFG